MEQLREEKQQPKSSTARARFLSPIWKLTPKHNGSTLYYDSFELRAIAQQLNKAIQGSNGSSSLYLHGKQLGRICRENGKIPRKISSSRASNATLDKKPSMKSTMNVPANGFVARLWKKVRQGWWRNDHNH